MSATTYTEINSLVDRRQIEEGVVSHLQTWLIPYLAQMERKWSLASGSIATPRAWRVEERFNRRPEDTMPFVAVVSPGKAPATPKMDGDGAVRAWWLVAVGAIVSAATEQDAKDLSGYYGAAIRLAMTQRPDLSGLAYGVAWNDEKYDDLPVIQERSIACCRLVFTIEIHDVLNLFEGFSGAVPPAEPYAAPVPLPTVTADGADVDIDISSVGGSPDTEETS